MILSLSLGLAAVLIGTPIAMRPTTPTITPSPSGDLIGSGHAASRSPDVPPAALETSAGVDGVSIAIDVISKSIAPGDEVSGVITIHNGSGMDLKYANAACGLPATVIALVRLPSPPAEPTGWNGVQAEFKQFALESHHSAGGLPEDGLVRVPVVPADCPVSVGTSLIAVGGDLRSEFAWIPELAPGVPAGAGEIVLTADVAVAKVDTDQSGGQFQIISAHGSISVDSSSKKILSADEAIDAVLLDKEFSSWLSTRRSGNWSVANVFLENPGPKAAGIVPEGTSWEIDLFLESPREWAIGFVDPASGVVRSVSYCNDPCDR